MTNHWHRYVIKQDKIFYDQQLNINVHKTIYKCAICGYEHVERTYFLKRR